MAPQSNLPPALPSLIGREGDLGILAALLPRTRLLTLTGPGGCGKTSLALQLASTLRSAYLDGVWLVELAQLGDPALVPEAVRAVLQAGGFPTGEVATQSPLNPIAAALCDRELLLVLDNCEHVVAACADCVEQILRRCPRVRILATSREVLRCLGETRWLVPSLGLPRGTADFTVEALRSCGAIQLFVERASATAPGFSLTPDNAGLIARICQRLDGIPLAIELAAGYIKLLSLHQIEDALTTDLRALAGGRRTAPARQQTLYATMEWSYRLLCRDDQLLLCRLCALAGDFALSLTQVVSDLPRDETIAALARLVDASLVQVGQREDEARFRILETIKQFGRQHLICSGEEAETLERTCRWVEEFVASTNRALRGDQWSAGLDRIGREYDHVRVTLHWLLARREIERALGLATELLTFWRQRGHIAEGRRWLDAVLAHCDPAVASPIVARAYNAAGVLALWQCDYERAGTCHETALALLQRGDGDAAALAMTRFRLGFLAEKRGEYTAAATHLEHSLQVYRELGDSAGEQMVRSRLGLVCFQQGDPQRAWVYLEESLAYQRAHDATGPAAAIVLNLGIVALERGQIRRATPLLEESLALNRRVGDELATIFSLTYLGFAHLLRADLTRAERSFRQALELSRSDTNREILVRLLDGLAMVAARQGDPLFAARLWGCMDTVRGATGMVYRRMARRLYDRELAAAQAQADALAFGAAWAEGAALSLEAAVSWASGPFCPGMPTLRAGYLPPSLHSSSVKPELRIKAFGIVQIWRGDRELTPADFVYTKARELLLYLLSSPARTKEQICLALWPDADQAHTHMNFRVVLHHLRRALGRGDWIVRSRNLYMFNQALECGFAYDVEVFEGKVAEAERLRASRPERAGGLLEEAVALYDGEYAENLGSTDWIALRQDALRHRYHDALLALGSLHLLQGETRRALAAFQQLTTQNKYAEEAHRGVIHCYVRMHDFSQAAEYYNRVRAMFEEELGIAPAPETLAALQPTALSTSA
jgi:non-specific serine/threonine protein kinase